MKPGDTVLILPSVILSELRLDKLVGYTATIISVNGTLNNIHGCWVLLPARYYGEREWYIPYNSLGI